MRVLEGLFWFQFWRKEGDEFFPSSCLPSLCHGL